MTSPGSIHRAEKDRQNTLFNYSPIVHDFLISNFSR